MNNSETKYQLYLNDAEEQLKSMEDNTIDLVVTSPPYDNLRSYMGVVDTWNHDKFCAIAKELYRVMKPGGVIVWVVNDKTEKGSETGTSFRQALHFMDIGFNLNDTMIWEKSNPMPQVKQPRYNQVFEYMFVFSKGTPKTFNPIMEPCKCAGQLYDSTCKNMGGENGRTHKTFNVNKEKVKSNIWNIAVAQNKTAHPAVYPLQIALDHIRSWSNEGDVVLDPFMGSGTTGLAALELNRNFIGIEMNEEYFIISNERILEKNSK
jgi:site-specific DNA-methyltransferase (adenine-specific)